MLRITRRPTADGAPTTVAAAVAPTIALEGRLVGPWVDELRRVVDDEADPRGVTIDLRGLTFADGGGVSTLRALRGAGVKLVGWSGFVEALVGTEQPDQGDRDVG